MYTIHAIAPMPLYVLPFTLSSLFPLKTVQISMACLIRQKIKTKRFKKILNEAEKSHFEQIG